ncbi:MULTISPECIES: NADH:flavin oxidoreductase/NADH oxidase family protein [Bacillus cereus group]|uniref:NADH:flavin oxidoreductase/NADH oxidase family protein n=1 Tax=Bacillus cereus group TaxID=86661 RepID=UPI001F5945E4|nr:MULTISPECIES: NADH:flavin oxidoreductase/NADH oxidase family protein [Bacillus cereus group]MDW3034980.1 NADH:flavin oxidoreductase/NADH oxidase family protein [Bacillus pacificus]
MKKTLLNTPMNRSTKFTVKNRFYKAAMSETMATKNNNPTEELVKLYGRWAQGGAGLLMTGNVMIDREALGEPGNVVIEDERDLDILKRWAKSGTQNGTQLWMQINHPGKQSPKTLSKNPVAPSAIPLTGDIKDFFNKPRELTSGEIWQLIKRFGNAARIAKKAGFTGVQIHAAHGYLINQFLSPHHNQRQDEWGGDLNGRMKFLIETYYEIRKQVGEEFPIGLKLNSADFQRGGFTEEESMKVLKKMDDLGMDLIEISGGNYENPKMFDGVRESTKKREAYFLDYAQKARTLVQAVLIVTGGFRSEEGMNEAIESGAVDMVGVGKLFALNPDFPNQIIHGNYHTVTIKPIRTGLKRLDKKISSMLELTWYEHQFKLMGKGKEPNPNYSVWKTVFQMISENGLNAFQKRRA